MSIPVIIGPFQLIAPIARGGMGEVWRAVHIEQRIPVAFKIIQSRISTNSAYLMDFENEMRAVAGLNHPGVVWIYDYGVIDESVSRASGGQLGVNSPYLVMEYADQGALSDIRGGITWVELRSLLLALLDALAHAHARGVIHRDLKPANVLLCGPN